MLCSPPHHEMLVAPPVKGLLFPLKTLRPSRLFHRHTRAGGASGVVRRVLTRRGMGGSAQGGRKWTLTSSRTKSSASPPILCSVVLLVAHSVTAPAAAMLHPADFLALQFIRKAMDDLPGSSFFASWDFTADPCGFSGVVCSGDHVVTLSLGDPLASSPGLSGHLDPALGRLSALEELSLVPGRVVGPLPPAVGQLTRLRFLALGRNFLSGTIPTELGSLRRLGTLDLSFNQLSGDIPAALAGMPALSNLILCHNHLSGGVPPFISPSLVRLDLKRNNLTGGVPALPASLQYLSLAGNRLTGPVDGALSRLVRLTHLDLGMNQLTGPIPPCVFSFPIADLRLQRNRFYGPVRPEAATAVAVTTVDLSYNRLSGEVPPALAVARRLYLNNNRFTGEVAAGFWERLLQREMEVLYLQHNFLTGMEMDPAAEMPASSSLCLQYNCMVPPPQNTCPVKAGRQRTRPTAQCVEWKG